MATITGNASNNVLIGTDQDDVINGLAGNDLLQGGAGFDVMDGGTGTDTADYREKILGISVTLTGSVDAFVFVDGVAEDTIRRLENIFGGSGDDVITGDNQANLFRGGLGADTLDGGVGNDTADYSDKTDAVVLTLDGANNAVATVGGAAEDTVRNIENVIGGAAGDTLTGDSLNNTFQGLGGADILDGGAGVDTADYREKTVSVMVALNGALDAVVSVGGAAEDTLRNIENIVGGSADDILIGDDQSNKLSGARGNDLLQGSAGADTLDGGEDIDTADYRDRTESLSVTLNGSSIATIFMGGVAEDSILRIEHVFGGSGDDAITGDALANLFRGGLGADTLDGGGGIDTADYSDKTDAVAVTLNGAADALVTVGGATEDTLRNIENLIGGAAGDTLTGDGLNNTLLGLGGADTLDGGAGSDTADYRDRTASLSVVLNGANASTVFIGGAAEDTIRNIESILAGSGDDSFVGDSLANLFDGGAGVDTVDYSAKTTSLIVALNGGTDARVTIGGVLEDTLRNVENVTGGSGSDTLTGDASSNALIGGGGGDILRGGLGSDVLDGAIGADTADFGDKTVAVALALDGASNAVATVGGVAEDLVRNIENIFGGSGADTLTGDGLANFLRGGAGADMLDGGAGVDSADYRDKTVSVTATLNGANASVVRVGAVDEDTIRNFENLLGGSAGDTLTGDAAANFLSGNNGADFLMGGLSVDVIDGGAGADSADFRDKTDAIAVTLNGAANVRVSVGGVLEDTLRNVENVFAGSGADTLIGDGLDNLFRGGLGQDVLDGGAGSDTADYREKSSGVSVTLNGSTDAIVRVGGVAEDTIRNIENVQGGSGNDILTGDAANNSLLGNDGRDLLSGGGGADVLDGGKGVDTVSYRYAPASVVLTLNGAVNATATVGGVAEDTVRNVENVLGGAASDSLTGDAAANLLSGGGGNDLLDGGLGADTFQFDTALDPASNVDTIVNFSPGDRMALDDLVFAALTPGALSGAQFLSGVGATSAQDADDRIIYDSSSGTLYYDADGLGGAAAVQFAVLDTRPALGIGEFTII